MTRRNIGRALLPILLLAGALLLFYRADITNAHGVGGNDGLGFITVMMAYRGLADFSLWQPWHAGGFPTLANPLYCINMLASTLLNQGPNILLHINLFFITMVIACALCAYCCFRRYGMGRPAACIGAFSLGASTPLVVLANYARLSGLLATAMAFIILACLAGPRMTRARHLAVGLCLAASLALIGHYALVIPGLFVLPHLRVRRILPLAGATAAGCAALAFLLVPLLSYQLGGAMRAEPIDFSPLHLNTVLNLLLPLDTSSYDVLKQKCFPFASLFILPGLALYLGAPGVRERLRRDAHMHWVLLASGLLILATCSSFTPLMQLYERVPIVSAIRHGSVYSHACMITLCFLAARGYDCTGKAPAIRVIAVAVALPACLLLATAMFNDIPARFLLNIGKWLAVSLLLLSALLVFQRRAWPLAAWAAVPLALNLFAVPSATGMNTLYARKNIRNELTGIVDQAQLGLLAGDQGYFKLLSQHINLPATRLADRPNHAGAAMYFLPAHREMLRHLTGAMSGAGRPQWALRGDCETYPAWLLDMLGIKYVECAKAPGPGMEPVQRLRGGGRLYRRLGWEVPVRFFDSWRVASGVLATETVARAWRDGTVLLDTDPDAPRPGPLRCSLDGYDIGTDRLAFEVTANKPVVLVIPEYQARGWRAEVNGEPAPCLTAYGMLRAVAVGAGKSRVVFVFRPLAESMGAWLSGAAWLVMAAWAIHSWTKHAAGTRQDGRDAAPADAQE